MCCKFIKNFFVVLSIFFCLQSNAINPYLKVSIDKKSGKIKIGDFFSPTIEIWPKKELDVKKIFKMKQTYLKEGIFINDIIDARLSSNNDEVLIIKPELINLGGELNGKIILEGNEYLIENNGVQLNEKTYLIPNIVFFLGPKKISHFSNTDVFFLVLIIIVFLMMILKLNQIRLKKRNRFKKILTLRKMRDLREKKDFHDLLDKKKEIYQIFPLHKEKVDELYSLIRQCAFKKDLVPDELITIKSIIKEITDYDIRK